MTELTNNELKSSLSEEIKAVREELVQHALDDAETFTKIKETMATLATKNDIAEMKNAFEDFVYALKVFKTSSKWGYRALLVFASIVIAIVGIGGGFKTIIGWFK